MKKKIRALQTEHHAEVLEECKRLARQGRTGVPTDNVFRVLSVGAPNAQIRRLEVQYPLHPLIGDYRVNVVFDFENERVVSRGVGNSMAAAVYSCLTDNQHVYDETWQDAWEAAYPQK